MISRHFSPSKCLHCKAFQRNTGASVETHVPTSRGFCLSSHFFWPVACSKSAVLQEPQTVWNGIDALRSSGRPGLDEAGCSCLDCDQEQQGDECSELKWLAMELRGAELNCGRSGGRNRKCRIAWRDSKFCACFEAQGYSMRDAVVSLDTKDVFWKCPGSVCLLSVSLLVSQSALYVGMQKKQANVANPALRKTKTVGSSFRRIVCNEQLVMQTLSGRNPRLA